MSLNDISKDSHGTTLPGPLYATGAVLIGAPLFAAIQLTSGPVAAISSASVLLLGIGAYYGIQKPHNALLAAACWIGIWFLAFLGGMLVAWTITEASAVAGAPVIPGR
ncbi:hypothetical protein DB346_11410 [Verrucomicrobia bacterium LW23]|nr:hypothetical protein DB346_11410 [Verrucomicrobia bacterium LW23]